jgi:glycosyltransferase involved in cell wall biosynthesis
MRILFLSAWFPYPPSNGSRMRVFNLLQALAPQHEVTLLCFADQPDVDPHAPALRALCRTVRVVPRPAFEAAAWRSRLAWLNPRPRSLVATFSPAMADAVARAIADCDLVVASELACAAYADRFGSVPALFEDVELGALHGQLASPRLAERWRARLMWAKYRRYLRDLLPRFRACTVVSTPERALLADVLGDGRAIHVLPNGIAAAHYAVSDVAPQPDTLIFTGSFRYGPNYEAMRWFVGSVWPRVRQARPAARLLITGDGAELPLPATGGIERTGFVDDLRPLLSTAWLAVAPIFAGGGTRLKILEAMAAGTPVVSTSKGAEGIDAVAGNHLLIADDPAAFAAHIVALLGDSALRARLSHAGRELVEQRYDWRLLAPQFEALVRSVAANDIGTRAR